MKKELWVVITVVGVFMGLMIGYSVPPMLEVGLIGEKKTVGISTEINDDLEDHYKNLQIDN
ncbi:MAG: hypothetical protein OEZ68_17210 [Gammaproteobacteria bacterium]|nr:hypothetical protein [Gammaproteobacteria bacterium]MDH5802543.1 hypothetical protein [Gammaproteobacteria bacterium]